MSDEVPICYFAEANPTSAVFRSLLKASLLIEPPLMRLEKTYSGKQNISGGKNLTILLVRQKVCCGRRQKHSTAQEVRTSST